MLSIIIPAYNSEKSIARCLNSVIKQKYNNFEIIVVNDGSTDNTENIVMKYKKKDHRIIYKKIKNSGSAVARNVGYEMSKGDYIYFLDADDYILDDYISNMMQIFDKYSVDFVCSSYQIMKNNIIIGKERVYLEEGLFSGEKLTKLYSFLICDDSLESKAPKTLWNKIFKKDFLQSAHIKFVPKLLMSQDVVYTTDAFLKCNSFYYFSQNNGYVYTVNESSRTQNHLPNLWEILKTNHSLTADNIMKSRKISQEQLIKQLDNLYLRNAMTALANIGKNNSPNYSESKELIKRICHDKKLIEVINKTNVDSLSIKRRVFFYAMKLRMYTVIYILINLER